MNGLRALISVSLRHWPWLALAASALMLALAHGFERFGGLVPCALCLKQREIYWLAMAVSALALAARMSAPGNGPLARRLVNGALVAVFLGGCGWAGFHVGVEAGWWPGLPECAAAAGADMGGADLLAALSEPMAAAGCDVVAWSFLGLSMAGWNLVASLKLAVWSALAACWPAGLLSPGRSASAQDQGDGPR